MYIMIHLGKKINGRKRCSRFSFTFFSHLSLVVSLGLCHLALGYNFFFFWLFVLYFTSVANSCFSSVQQHKKRVDVGPIKCCPFSFFFFSSHICRNALFFSIGIFIFSFQPRHFSVSFTLIFLPFCQNICILFLCRSLLSRSYFKLWLCFPFSRLF